MGSFVIGPYGGAFQRGKFQVDISPQDSQKPVEIQVTVDENAEETSYGFRGELDQMMGSWMITLPIPDEFLSSDLVVGDEHSSEIYIEMETGFYAPSLVSSFQSEIPIPSEVDLDSGTISAILNPGSREHLALGFHKLASPASVHLEGPQSAQESSATFRIKRGKIQYGWNEHFHVSFIGSESAALAMQIPQLFEDFRADLIHRGFRFGKYHDYQLPVVIKAKTHNNAEGYFNHSFWSGPSITLRADLLKGSSPSNELEALMGHELFHLAHYVAHPRYYTPYDWLDEAAAMWYEPLVLSDASWLPLLMNQYDDFFRTPLFYPPSGQERVFGYSGGFLLRYLDAAYPGMVAEAYRIAPDIDSDARALQRALSPYGTTVGLEWPSFMAAYLLNPSSIVPSKSSLYGYYRKVTLIGENTFSIGNAMDASISFTPGVPERARSGEWINESRFSFESQSGFLSPEPASMSLSIDMNSLTAEAICLSIANDQATRAIFELPGEVTVTVRCPEFNGVMVYAVPIGGSLEGAQAIAGPPSGYLSSGHPGHLDSTTLQGFSHRNGNGQFDRLVLIPFNAEDGTHGNQPSTIQITVVYKPPLPVLELKGLWEQVNLTIEDAQSYYLTFPTTYSVENGEVNVTWDFINQTVSGDISGHLYGSAERPEAAGLSFSFDQLFDGTIDGPPEKGMNFYEPVPIHLMSFGFGRTEAAIQEMGSIWAQSDGTTVYAGTLTNIICINGLLSASLEFESVPEETDLTYGFDIPASIKSHIPAEMMALLTPTNESYTRTYGWKAKVVFEIPEDLLPFVPGCLAFE